ncbi:MAG: hypothetical protein KG029_03090 [Bacteroidetes bacterium]|nr:hypothetical protein [Bacteroidota bacterium]
MNAAPNFFPDMLLYFVFNAVFQDFRLAMLLFSAFQYSLLLYLLNLVLKEISKNVTWNILAVGNLMMLSVFFVTSVTGDFSFTFYIISISYHLGPFIMAIACLLILMKYMKTGRNKYLFIMLALGFLGVFSNRLFIVMFVFPSASLVLFWKSIELRPILIKSILTIITFTISGIIAFKILKGLGIVNVASTDWKMFYFSNISSSFKIMFSQHLRYIYLMDFRGIIVILSTISFFIILRIAIKYFLRVCIRQEKDFNLPKVFFSFFFVAFFLIVLFMPVINGSYVGWAILRYNVYVFYFALFSYTFIIYYYINKNKHYGKRIFIYFFLVFFGVIDTYTIFYSTKHSIREGHSEYFNYYPEYVECADKISKEHNLQYGVAEYWLAKKISMFSKNDLRVYTVHSNAAIWYHVMNKNWYYKTGKGKYGNPEFKFVISNSLNHDSIRKHMGEPINIFDCSGTLKVWEYPEFQFDKSTRRPSLLVSD